jgi:prepilin-type N-terminal cleavage/methylation domain-containing protein|tara:strand:+ start:357 stop:866 length:510 start_codon:yes stop_codon:yes gene_type:complete
MKKAFTLVELMVVMAIGALLLGISIPSIWSLMKKAPLEQGISDVESMCRLARAEAIVKQRAMDVVLNETEEVVALTTAARVINKPDSLTGVMIKTTEETELIDQAILEVDLQIIEPEADEFTMDEIRIRFYPNGTSETLELRVVGDGEAYRLTLDPVTGRTTVLNEDRL